MEKQDEVVEEKAQKYADRFKKSQQGAVLFVNPRV